MKAWTVFELDNIVSALAPLEGLRLQEVQTTERDVILGFYSSEGLLWLWIDLNAINPGLLPWTSLPVRPQPEKTPLQLFLRAHFVGRTLREIARPAEHGRVVLLKFGAAEDDLSLEVRLFPHGRNLIAHSAKKKISWLKEQAMSPPVENDASTRELRSLDDLREQWIATRQRGKGAGAKPASGVQDIKARLERDLMKKQAAREKVLEELKRKQDLPYRAIGDWLKSNQSLDVPKEWDPFVDRRRKLAWNIEQCYTKAREAEGKIFGTEKRLAVLDEEIARVRQRLSGPESQLKPEPPPQNKPTLAKIEAQGRTLRLADDMTVVMGKSADDNLKILRKARAWDLWFHLRDFPSSHAVLFRNKGTQIGDAKLFEVAAWFVRNHLGSKAAGHAGEKFDLVVTECRFVRPIKGDKIGRVNYHDERLLIYQFPG